MARPEITELTIVRRDNILLLKRDAGIEKNVALASFCGINPSTMAAFMGPSPKQNISDKMANKIEDAFQKRHGWLDRQRDALKKVSPGEMKVSVTGAGFTVTDHPITQHQLRQILRILLLED